MNEIKYEYNKNLNTPFLVVTENVRKKYKNLSLMHFHNQMQIVLMLQGDAVLETLYEKISLEKNDIAFINCNEFHRISLSQKENNDKNKYVSIIFDKSVLNISNEENFMKEYIDKYTSTQIKISTSLLVRNAINELLVADNEYAVRSLLPYIWYNLIVKDSEKASKNSNYHNDSLEKILHYIDENFSSHIKLEELCKIGNISKSALHRIFIKHLGVSPYTYIVEYKLNKSIKLLESSDLSISEISFKVGYESTSQYIKLFKNYIGKTPLKYRNLINN